MKNSEKTAKTTEPLKQMDLKDDHDTDNNNKSVITTKKLLMVSLGCAKNLVDSENMCQIVKDAGIELVFDPKEANIIVINTCGFIESAKKEAIDKILEMADYKNPMENDSLDSNGIYNSADKKAKCEFIIVTGCLAQRYSKDIQLQIPEVDAVLGTAAYGMILQTIEELYNNINNDSNDHRQIVHTEAAGSLSHLSTSRTPTTKGYAYIKVAEGCSNRCSFCAIPGIRGDFHSRPIETLVQEAQYLSNLGIYEVILIAQDTTRYGTDIYGYQALPELIRNISVIENIRTIRILYCYADGITDELILEMKNNPKVANYIEMPIQHSNNAILKRMNRRDTTQKIEQVVKALRKAMPDITIRTTVMVGFPGETNDEFEDLLKFINKMKFDLLGCFIFSPEEDTPAYKMRPKVLKSTATKRYNAIMAAQKIIVVAKNFKKIKKKFQITIESITPDGVFYLGRSYAQAPEIDPMTLVVATIQPLEYGKQYRVKIVETSEYDLIGVTIK